jgi:CHAD domain-containing protein
MTYRLKLRENVAEGFARIGAEQFDRARAYLADSPHATAIHETRKCIKRLRALLRLFKGALDPVARANMDRALRDAGRMLSASRDDWVLTGLVRSLAADEPSLCALAARLETTLAGNSEGGTAPDPSAHDRASASRALAKAARQWRRIKLGIEGPAAFAGGLESTYRKCRNGFEQAFASKDDVAFHEWRKSVQRHWRQMVVLQRGWPEWFQVRIASARELSNLLGASQDLALLRSRLDAGALPGVTAREDQVLRDLIADRQQAMRAAAEPRGERLVAMRPRSLVGQVCAYWNAAVAMPPSPLAADQQGQPSAANSHHRAATEARSAAARTPKCPTRSGRRKRSTAPRPGR